MNEKPEAIDEAPWKSRDENANFMRSNDALQNVLAAWAYMQPKTALFAATNGFSNPHSL